MKLHSTNYIDEKTGNIVEYKPDETITIWCTTMKEKFQIKNFIFRDSKPETIRKIGEFLLQVASMNTDEPKFDRDNAEWDAAREYENKEKYFVITDDAKTPTSELLKRCKEKFDCWSYWNDKELDENFPVPKKPMTRYFKKTEEPDPETLGKSADEIDPDGTKGCTLREYMLMQLAYFEETGKHLDEKGWTLCTSSRLRSGGVADGGWSPSYRRVSFFWYNRDYSDPDMGARLAITL